MRQAVQAQSRLGDANCPLLGMVSYSDRPISRETPRLSPSYGNYGNSCFLRAALHYNGDTPLHVARMPNNKYAFLERVTVVPKVQWHCR